MKSLKRELGLGSVLAVTALILSGCASLSGVESKENLAKLKYGMSESEVRYLLGTPDSVLKQSKADDRWVYEYKNSEKKGRNIYIDFRENQLVKTGELSGREIAAAEETRESGVCTRRAHPEMMIESTCLK